MAKKKSEPKPSNELSLAKILSNHHLILLLLTTCLALFLRMYKISTPLADWHSWRQADTASVTRELVKGEGSLFKPEFQDLSNIPSGLENPEGYRMVEFPILNQATAWIYTSPLAQNMDLVTVSRLVTVMLSLITIWLLYGIVWETSQNTFLSVTSAFTFSVLPYSVFYSRVILPEPAMVCFSLAAIYFFIRWVQAAGEKSSMAYYLLSWSTMAVALLLKPTALFFTPVLMLIALYKFGLSAVKKPLLWFYLASLGPLLGWRFWIEQYPEGIPAARWLFNGNGIRLKPAWWRWLFAERIAKLILGYWGIVLAAFGLVGQQEKKTYFDVMTAGMVLGMLAYLIIFATGNVQHDYYQIVLIPTISIVVARGIYWLLTSHSIQKLIAVPLLTVVVSLSLFLGWYEVRGYYNINNPGIVEAGQAVDQLTPADARVIAPYGGDTAFLFQTNRRGWPIGSLIEERIAQGATHYVTVTYDDEARELEKRYATVDKTDTYLILDLTKSETNSPDLPAAIQPQP